MMLKDFIHRLIQKPEGLSASEMKSATEIILSGKALEVETASFLTALSMRPVTPEQLQAVTEVLMAHAILLDGLEDAFDCCGTGGDGLHTLNISTAVSFCLAGCGVRVAKHGNRAASSQCGAADVLEECGIALIADTGFLRHTLATLGYAFLMAPHHHPSLRHLSPIRKALGFRTLFNLTGPLVNPAGTKTQLIGTYSEAAQDLLAQTIALSHDRKAWVVTSADGMDELSLAAPAYIHASDGKKWVWQAEDFGLSPAPLEAIQGGDAAYNAAALMRLFNGEPGAYHDAVILNAAACLILLDKAKTPIEAAQMAAQSLQKDQAKQVFEAYREQTRQYG